jgi:hypothetical protein
MSMIGIRSRIAVQANMSVVNVKGALFAPGRNHNPECEACQ